MWIFYLLHNLELANSTQSQKESEKTHWEGVCLGRHQLLLQSASANKFKFHLEQSFTLLSPVETVRDKFL